MGIGAQSSFVHPSHLRVTFEGLVAVAVVDRSKAARGLEEGANLVGSTGRGSVVIGCLLGGGID